MTMRAYNAETDRDAVRRIWLECGWAEDGKFETMDHVITAGRSMVAELNGEAECLVLSAPGTIRYLHRDLPFACVTGVTTSRIARKQGFAGRLTARAIAADVEAGAVVAGLGMFEQGFYNRLGFGTGGYEQHLAFDPAMLDVEPTTRVPRRLTNDDWQAVHDNRLQRIRRHGACCLQPQSTRAEMHWTKEGFGLGYSDSPGGPLTHHVWMGVRGDVENGPYTLRWMAFQNAEQFLELMGAIKMLGDQVLGLKMFDPPGLHLQDLIKRPFAQRRITQNAPTFAARTEAWAWWQMRICDLPACMEQTCLPGHTARFNLVLTDPIERYLVDAETRWHGVGGSYVVTLGPESSARVGSDSSLPTMEASVNAFTRLWLGVRPASGLAFTDDIVAPLELLEELDNVVRVPEPMIDWDF